MESARIMNRPEDYKLRGLDPDHVQPWEDGRRMSDKGGLNEVWYFDANLEDGSKVIVGFRPKMPEAMREDGDTPNVNINITTPEGKDYAELLDCTGQDYHMGTDKCDVHYGPHYCERDFSYYDVHYEAVNGLGADLHYEALTEPFRPGTGEIALGNNDEFFYSDMNVPKSRVTGTLTYEDKTVEVSGYGYHDHQWMNIMPMAAWHHWLWGRFYGEDYTMFIYDYVTAERFGFKHVPLFCLQDKNGKTIFESNGEDMEMSSTKFYDEATEKEYPKTSHYVFEHGGKRVVFDVEWKQIIEVRDSYHGMSPAEQARMDAMGVRPSYLRFFADGKLEYTADGTTQSTEGDMIYEYSYWGLPDERVHM